MGYPVTYSPLASRGIAMRHSHRTDPDALNVAAPQEWIVAFNQDIAPLHNEVLEIVHRESIYQRVRVKNTTGSPWTPGKCLNVATAKLSAQTSASATNNPQAGASVIILTSATFEVGQVLKVSSGGLDDYSLVTAVSAGVSVTVERLEHNHTTPTLDALPAYEAALATRAGNRAAQWVVKDNIADGAYGWAYDAAEITGLNTSGNTPEAELFLSTSGDFTETAPTGADDSQQVVGVVLTSHASTGKIWLAPGARRVIKGGTSWLQDGGITTAKIANNAVTNAIIRDSGACSVIGRAANSSGDPADISAGANNTMLVRQSDTLQFVAITTVLANDAEGDPADVTLTRADGTSSYFARRDHAHALDVTIAPTWGGKHTFNAGIVLTESAAPTFTTNQVAAWAANVITSDNESWHFANEQGKRLVYGGLVGTPSLPAMYFGTSATTFSANNYWVLQNFSGDTPTHLYFNAGTSASVINLRIAGDANSGLAVQLRGAVIGSTNLSIATGTRVLMFPEGTHWTPVNDASAIYSVDFAALDNRLRIVSEKTASDVTAAMIGNGVLFTGSGDITYITAISGGPTGTEGVHLGHNASGNYGFLSCGITNTALHPMLYNASGHDFYLGSSGPFVRIQSRVEGRGILILHTNVITGAVADGYAAYLQMQPTYNAASALTVDRHNYIDLENVVTTGSATVTDACVIRFNAAAGTHKATVGATTKATPSGVDAWMKININETIHYVPAYLSTTA